MTSIDDKKAQLRKEMLNLRKTIVQNDQASLLRDKFLSEPSFKKAKVIAAYWPMAGEIDIRLLLDRLCQDGHVCALPVVAQSQAPLQFRKWQSGDTLIDGPHGTKQPGPDAEIVLPDLVLVPLLAFDLSGARLGFGGGYYDRTLAALDGAVAVGIAYDRQEVSAVPMDRFDKKMDWIVTPNRAIQIKE